MTTLQKHVAEFHFLCLFGAVTVDFRPVLRLGRASVREHGIKLAVDRLQSYSKHQNIT
jgi:hypothetical protein